MIINPYRSVFFFAILVFSITTFVWITNIVTASTNQLNSTDQSSEQLDIKGISEGIQKTATQSMFTILASFLIGIALVIYGLRLSLKARHETTGYLKAIMWALIAPVIIIIVSYQINIFLEIPIILHESIDTFLLISILIWIPTGAIIFLLVAEHKLVRRHQQTQQEMQKLKDDQAETQDPLKILQIRLAKGEITKEQYEEMIKLIR